MANWIDKVIAAISPRRALARAQARHVLGYYEAARPSRTNKQRRETGSGNAAISRAGTSMREQARHLDQNHDIARGALNVLVANIVGPNGIGIEPQPRTRDGKIHTALAEQINRLLTTWQQRPEVTWTYDWPAAQRIACRTWLRDGEVLAQHIIGTGPTISHGTPVPYSIELIEPDHLPMGLNTDTITMGVELNAWNRPIAYHLHKRHPGGTGAWTSITATLDTKRVEAERIIHAKLTDRIGAVRGVTVLASVLLRLDDIKDYETSERVAAKVAASMAAYIKKGAPDAYPLPDDLDGDGENDPRELKFSPGMIFDDLQPGEEIGTIDTTRPNTNLEDFRNGQLRAVAAGVGTTYSSLSRNYNGTYSSQRQELVEGYGLYATLANEFTSQFVRPIYKKLIDAAIASGQLVLPGDLDIATVSDALYLPPQMPWIDPVKEANAWATLESNGYASGPEIIRRRGHNPNDVLEQEAAWRQKAADKGITFDNAAASADAQPTTQDTPNARKIA